MDWSIMSDTQRGICSECGTEQLVNKDNTIRKHGDCPGAGQPPAPEDSTPPADDPGGEAAGTAPVSASQDDGTDDWDDPEAETADDEQATPGDEQPAPEEHPAPAAPPADADDQPPVENLGYGKDAYRWEITIAQPAIYLDDPAWHAANSLLAAQEAADAGHVPTGEAKCVSVAATEDEGGLTLTYLLPIETAS